MGSLPLVLIFSIGTVLTAAQEPAQAPTSHPEIIAGPWESSSASGIDGIFFKVYTLSSRSAGREEIGSQEVAIRVYHRLEGKETGGWFVTNKKAKPELYGMSDDDSFTLFDGQRLRIHFADVVRPFVLDVVFSLADQSWAGTWLRGGQSFHVVLQRPAPNLGAKPSAFVGDWENMTDPHFGGSSGSLHIRQSIDGKLTVWLDRTSYSFDARTQSVRGDQRNGELLHIRSVTEGALALETTGSGGAIYRYHGSLSEDHQTLTGVWEDNGYGWLNAPAIFRRVAKTSDATTGTNWRE